MVSSLRSFLFPRQWLHLAAVVLLIGGFTPTIARAQVTVDNPNGIGTTILFGLDGSNAVGAYLDQFGAYHGFVYNGSNFTPLDVPGALSTNPFDIQGSNIVGSYIDSMGHNYSFLYDGTIFTTLNVAGSLETTAHGIDGSNIVGEYVDSSNHVLGFLYDGTNYTTLSGPTGATETVPYGISGNKILGTYADATGTDHGFLYDGTTYATFDDPFAGTGFDVGTYASALQGNDIGGSYTDASGINHGFLYDGAGFTTLNNPLAGYNPFINMGGTFAYGFSNGRVSGTYFDAFGSHGYVLPVASLVPEPGGLALLGGCGISLLGLARRRQYKKRQAAVR